MSMDSIQSDISHIREIVQRLEQSLDNMDKTLFKGNGTPAIVPTVKANCKSITDLEKDTDDNTEFIKTVKITIRNFRWLIWVLGTINVGGLLAMYQMFNSFIK